MTIIAYRNGVMAADSVSLVERTKLTHDRKVIKRAGHLFGIAGDVCPDLAEAADWFLTGGMIDRRYRYDMLVVMPSGRVELTDHIGRFNTITEEFFAIGCGADCALGAMHAGADARQAVAAAIRWVDGCGGRVTSRRL